MKVYVAKIWLGILVAASQLGATWFAFLGGMLVSAATEIMINLLYSSQVHCGLSWVIGTSLGLFCTGIAVTAASLRQSEASEFKNIIFRGPLARRYRTPRDRWNLILTDPDYSYIARHVRSMMRWLLWGAVFFFVSVVLVIIQLVSGCATDVPAIAPTSVLTPTATALPTAMPMPTHSSLGGVQE